MVLKGEVDDKSKVMESLPVVEQRLDIEVKIPLGVAGTVSQVPGVKSVSSYSKPVLVTLQSAVIKTLLRSLKFAILKSVFVSLKLFKFDKSDSTVGTATEHPASKARTNSPKIKLLKRRPT
jgi:hypothetical protein